MRAGWLGSAACPLRPRPLFFSSERVLSIEVLKNMAILPAIAFAVLATIIVYASVRGYRRLFPSPSALASSKSASLPGPVVGKSSGWSWAKLNLKSRWPRRLSISGIPRVRVRVPWSRSSSLDSGVAPKTKNSKNLGIELLPTTGLPPPPSSLPTPKPTPVPSTSHVLVDVSVPSSPPAPAIPRAPSPPFPAPVPGSYFSGAKALLLPLHLNTRPSSPHSLLATTTPPKKHKRSRSLGGVPVRRLSNGALSSLRNAVEMDDLGVRNGHVRDTSREHLLIDFSSSYSSSTGRSKGEVEDDPDISPAASDIGVLPLNTPLRTRSENPYGYGHEALFVVPPPLPSSAPIAVLPKQVARQVPLVDLEEEDDSWKWFSEAPVVAPAILPALPAVRAVLSSKAATNSMEMKPVAVKMEKLVDLDEPMEAKARTNELVSEVSLIDVEERNYEEGILVDVTEKPLQAMPRAELVMTSGDIVAPKVDEAIVQQEDVPLPIDNVDQKLVEVLEDPFADPPHIASTDAAAAADPADDPFADPPLELAAIALPPTPSSSPVALSAEQDWTSSIDATLHATLEGLQETWSWEDSHDPWHGHMGDVEQQTVDTVQQSEDDIAPEAMSSQDETPVEAAPAERDSIEATPEVEAALLEHSPAGVLIPTVVDDEAEEEHIPPLDLYVEEKSSAEAATERKDDEADEDTPKATPSSLAQELPPWGPLEALPIDDDDYHGAAQEAADLEASPVLVSPVALSPALGYFEEYDDPELLDLPLAEEPIVHVPSDEEATYFGPTPDDLSLVLTNPGGALFSVEEPSEDARLEKGDGQHTPTKRPLAQTPTPPASPPPLSHGLSLSTRALKFGSNHNSRAVSPVALSAPLLVLSKINDELDLSAKEVKAAKSVALEEDKENVAPPMFSKPTNSEDSAAQTRPAWSIRAQDAPALGVPSAGYVLGSSPRAMKRALSSESQKENVSVSIEEVKPVVIEASKENQETEPVVDALVEAASTLEEAPAADDASTEGLAPLKETPLVVAPQIVLSESSPGTFPEPATSKVAAVSPSTNDTPSSPTTATSTAVSTTVAATAPTRRRTLSEAFAYTIPSVRRLARSPLDVALAMQLRPGLGAGADPAWMVRFLMAMYGWLAVVIAGQDF